MARKSLFMRSEATRSMRPAMIPVVGNAAKGISEGVQNANNGLVGRVTEKSQQASRERKKTGTTQK